MSAERIDVLAALDALSQANVGPLEMRSISGVRTAVANLLEAANFLKITLTTDHPVETDFEESLHRFTDALARIGAP